MTQLEYIKIVQGIADTMARNSVRPEDVRYIQAVEDYNRLRNEGHKYEYIMHYLCEQYDLRRTALYKAIRRLSKQMEI